MASQGSVWKNYTLITVGAMNLSFWEWKNFQALNYFSFVKVN
jgi:hypothetical protein